LPEQQVLSALPRVSNILRERKQIHDRYPSGAHCVDAKSEASVLASASAELPQIESQAVFGVTRPMESVLKQSF
jgi:hypothetical protein